MSNKWILSATEIETFDTCRRKWAYRYLDKLKTPPSKAALLGIKVHECLQKYLTSYSIEYGTTEGRVASPGLGYLPKNIPPENIEKHICFAKSGILFQGYIDFYEDVGSQTWLIGDHKTTANLKTALTPALLKQNIQGNLYGQWGFLEKGAKKVNLRWIYYRTKSTPKAMCVEASLTKEEAEKNFEPILRTSEEILKIISAQKPSNTQQINKEACFKYGRCPYYAHCQRDVRRTASIPNNPFEIARKEEKTEFTLSNLSESKSNSFHLFIDCVPTKNASYTKLIELSELLKPILEKIQTEKGLKHYRLAGYGQHVGLIANYLSQHLEKHPFDDRTAILSSAKTPEGCDTLQTLTAAAQSVVRGF